MKINQLAFFSMVVPCQVQLHTGFPYLAMEYYSNKDTMRFKQQFPALRDFPEKCAKCIASTGFNGGKGIDCWFTYPLPVGEDAITFIYDNLANRIRLLTRDREYASQITPDLTEMGYSRSALPGLIKNGWVINHPLLSEKIVVNTGEKSEAIDTGYILSYLFRDGSMITRTRLLAQIFSKKQASDLPLDSPLRVLSVMLNFASNISRPIKTWILVEK